MKRPIVRSIIADLFLAGSRYEQATIETAMLLYTTTSTYNSPNTRIPKGALLVLHSGTLGIGSAVYKIFPSDGTSANAVILGHDVDLEGRSANVPISIITYTNNEKLNRQYIKMVSDNWANFVEAQNTRLRFGDNPG